MNPQTSNALNQEIERNIKNWLRGCRDRNGGRKRRYLAAEAKRAENRENNNNID